MTFEADFKDLAGFPPMSWQIRLFREWLERGHIPAAVDLPTGLGKTAVMALWLLAREQAPILPRRLVYVVDRRAVVDQATEFANRLRESLDTQAQSLKARLGLEGRSLSISTLRGQYVDNREWLDDPSAIAIIVGTVDMIGSRLLFEGYGVSRKMRPYHAGLLGADTLVVLDEAHLVPPFEKLLETIETDHDQFRPKLNDDRNVIPPLKLLSLSATGRERLGNIFRLDESDLNEPHLDHPVTRLRLNAKKSLTLQSVNAKELPIELAKEAWQISNQGQDSIRCIVYCDSRKTAEDTKAHLDKLILQAKTKAQVANLPQTELFVGARRVREREKAAERLKHMDFIAGSAIAVTAPMFLIATSAGEVGVDLDADHMACDLVAWERMVQRLGRVNRRGEGNARIIVLDTGEPKAAKADTPTPDEVRLIKQHGALYALFASLPQHDDGSANVSPGAIRALKTLSEADEHLRLCFADATSPVPLRPALTRALVDAWSMTSLKEHTGRPEVDPWLRGWVDTEPQTAVVWRKHLPVRSKGTPAEPQEIEAFFEAASPHASEILETETWRVVEWLIAVATRLVGLAPESEEQDDLPDLESSDFDEFTDRPKETPVIPRGDEIVAFVLSPTGDLLRICKLQDFASKDKKILGKIDDQFRRTLAGKTLVMDARLGGLTDDGLLNDKTTFSPATGDDSDDWLQPLESARLTDNSPGRLTPVIRFRVRSVKGTVEEQSQSDRDWRERLRFAAELADDGETLRWLIIDKWSYDAATEDDRSVGRPQSLAEHQRWTANKARTIADRIGLPEVFAQALIVAARLHDEGKQAELWQRAFNAAREGGPYAKTKGPCNWRLLNGYRHEFGSLRYAQADPELKALPLDQQDLILHMIAAHHGHARPVIPTTGCQDAPPSALTDRARDVALRFARLQQRWGPWGLAWWESLLRAADQQASRENDSKRSNAVRETD